MKIITKVVIDMESGQTLHEEGFDYEGQLTLAGGGSQKSGGSQPTYILPGLLPGIQGAAQNSIINPAMGNMTTVPWNNTPYTGGWTTGSGANVGLGANTSGSFNPSISQYGLNGQYAPMSGAAGGQVPYGAGFQVPASLMDINMNKAMQQISGAYGRAGLARSGIAMAGEQNAIGQLALQAQQQNQGALTNLLSAGTGQTTAPTKSSTGMSVICTWLNHEGLLDDETYRADCYYGKTHIPPEALVGYHMWAMPLVRLMQASPLVTRLVAPMAIAWATTMRARVLGDCDEHWLGRALLKYGVPICAFLGRTKWVYRAAH